MDLKESVVQLPPWGLRLVGASDSEQNLHLPIKDFYATNM
jgi:hypothetical protein